MLRGELLKQAFTVFLPAVCGRQTPFSNNTTSAALKPALALKLNGPKAPPVLGGNSPIKIHFLPAIGTQGLAGIMP
jgi:hypothetical protein